MRAKPTALLLALALACAGRQGAFPEDVAGDAADVPADAVADLPADVSDVPSDTRVPVPARGRCMPNDAAFPVRPAVTEPASLPRLQVLGRDIVTPDGTPVALRGVNFGSWLQMESWIPGIGPLNEGELYEAMPGKADEFGVRDLFDAAWETIGAEWSLELRSEGPLLDDARAAMYADAGEDREADVDAFWAWFDSVPWVFAEQSMWEWLGKRHGWDRANDLREAFADAWITELDVQRVKALGLNLIRVPVWYDALETDLADGKNGFRPEGWRHLDDVARWARKHGLYVMIDLHGVPGGQSVALHAGLRDGGHLWEEPACRDKAARLWKAVASYFAGDPHVAILDLMNEPMSVQSAAQYRDVHDAIYRAIREADGTASFIVMVEEGYKPGSYLASPAEMGWTNAMFSLHLYPTEPDTAAEYVERMGKELQIAEGKFDFSRRFACPVFLGEFSPFLGDDAGWTVEAMDGTLALLNARGVHWAPWTWKYHRAKSAWGLYAPVAEGQRRIDVSQPFDALKADLQAMASTGWVEWKDYGDVLRARSGDPVKPLDLPGTL